MKHLTVSKDLSLPLDAVTQTFAILAKRGAGKSYCASVMAEEMLKAGQTIIAIDPTGAWWGLQSMYPVVIFGGERANVPLEKSAGEVVARAIVENRFSAVLDLSLFRKGELIQFMTAFAETLYRLNRDAVHLFVDEADAVAPQRTNYGTSSKESNEARMLGAMEDIVRRGRKRGIGCTLITQRASVINKNVLTQCECLVALRMSHPLDIKAVMDWVNVHADPDAAKEMMESLPDLPTGDAWFWWPAADIFKRAHVRERETFDSGATPKPGQVAKQPKKLVEIDLNALGEQIKATVEKAKAEDPKALKSEISRLNAELKKKQTTVIDQSAIERAIQQRDREWEKAVNDKERIIGTLTTKIQRAAKELHLNGEMKTQAALPAKMKTVIAKPAVAVRQTRPKPERQPDATLGKCELSILRVLAQYDDGCEIGKLALLSGYRVSGGFRNSLSALRTAGLITGENVGTMWITDDGRAVDDFEPLPAGSDQAAYWLNHRSFGKCERSILDELLKDRNGQTIEELAASTGYEVSGGFRNSLSALRTAGVIVGKNTETMRASDELFD